MGLFRVPGRLLTCWSKLYSVQYTYRQCMKKRDGTPNEQSPSIEISVQSDQKRIEISLHFRYFIILFLNK